MNRLVNALAFAAVVIAAFIMDSNLPQKVASSPLVARVVNTVRCERPASVVVPEGLPPQLQQARMGRAMERMQAAQERLAQVDMRRAEASVRTAERAAGLRDCKVVKIDQ